MCVADLVTESEGLGNGEEREDCEERGSFFHGFGKDSASTTGDHIIHTTRTSLQDCQNGDGEGKIGVNLLLAWISQDTLPRVSVGSNPRNLVEWLVEQS